MMMMMMKFVHNTLWASFRPLWGQNSVARSHFVLLIHQICSFLPPQRTGPGVTKKFTLEKWCIGIIKSSLPYLTSLSYTLRRTTHTILEIPQNTIYIRHTL